MWTVNVQRRKLIETETAMVHPSMYVVQPPEAQCLVRLVRGLRWGHRYGV